MKNRLTHLDNTGSAQMVDITQKKITSRIAVAQSKVLMKPSTLKFIKSGETKKGDVIGIARLAGIMAAKKTADLIPLCHQLPLSKISIQFFTKLNPCRVEIEATIKTTTRTGVEMEALTAVTVSALTIYDMMKSIDKNMIINETCLLLKDGGESGLYKKKENL